MHPLYQKADRLSGEVIGAAIEVHRQKGPGLIESIYERCLLRELELRSIPATTQKIVRVEYKGLVFEEPLRFDLLVDNSLLVELKAVEVLHPSSKAQLFSYMKLLNIPLGLLINFHEPVLKNGIFRMILPGANQAEGGENTEVSLSNSHLEKTFLFFVAFCKDTFSQSTGVSGLADSSCQLRCVGRWTFVAAGEAVENTRPWRVAADFLSFQGARSAHTRSGLQSTSNRRKGEKATQPGGRERFGFSGYVARSSSRHRGTDILVARALPSNPSRSRAAGPGILTGSLSLGLAASFCHLG